MEKKGTGGDKEGNRGPSQEIRTRERGQRRVSATCYSQEGPLGEGLRKPRGAAAAGPGAALEVGKEEKGDIWGWHSAR